MLDEGDINWIIPGRLAAMSSPALNMSEGLRPIFYFDYFDKCNVTAVVRLNEKLYVEEDFTERGIRVYPMEFPDG